MKFSNVVIRYKNNQFLQNQSLFGRLGHMAMVDQPPEMASQIASWWQKNAGDFFSLNVYHSTIYNFVKFTLPERSETSLKVNIYSLNGTEVLSQVIKTSDMVNLTSISNGLYIFKIQGTSRSYSGKLLIKH